MSLPSSPPPSSFSPSIVPSCHRARFVEARTAFCHDDVATARPLFDELAAALPGNAEVQLYAAWSRARMATALSEKERDVLEQLARKALGSHQSLALPLCILAQAAVRRADFRVAQRLFRRASEADPALVEARRGLRMLERQPQHFPPLRSLRGRDARRSRQQQSVSIAFTLLIVVLLWAMGGIADLPSLARALS